MYSTKLLLLSFFTISLIFLSAELTTKIGEQVKCYVMASTWEEVTSRDLLHGKSSILGKSFVDNTYFIIFHY